MELVAHCNFLFFVSHMITTEVEICLLLPPPKFNSLFQEVLCFLVPFWVLTH